MRSSILIKWSTLFFIISNSFENLPNLYDIPNIEEPPKMHGSISIQTGELIMPIDFNIAQRIIPKALPYITISAIKSLFIMFT